MLDFTDTIAIAGDHAGFELKKYLKRKLSEEGFRLEDFGTFTADSVDYPDVIHPLANAIEEEKFKQGIIICGSGNGVAITANKYKHA